jgi:hypothetical protein
MADPKPPGPNDESGAYRSMSSTWQKITDIRAGADAVRAKGTAYLPKFEEEGQKDYERRNASAPWRPEFNDALGSLVAKPFSRDVGVTGAETDELKAFIEDVDTRGNNLTVFARDMMADGVSYGLHGILVDHPPNPGTRTVAEERAAGLRPYFVHVKAEQLIAVYFAMVSGKMRAVHARIRETVVERAGFAEKVVVQVRVLDPGTWQVWRENDKKEWGVHDQGATSLPYVPLVIWFTGERKGDHEVKPPLKDLADLLIELYRALSREDEVLNFAGYPMLSGNGFNKPAEKIVVGPRSILYAPGAEGITTSWTFIQPDSSNLAEIRAKIGAIQADMHRLGMMPMVQKAGGISATATAVDTAKAHSVLQMWSITLKDALEQAFVIAEAYGKRESKVEIDVFTDFTADPFAQAPLNALREARKSGDLSRRTYWQGLRRFDVLPADFDAEAEDEQIATETEGLEPEQPIDPRTGLPIVQPGDAGGTEDQANSAA